MWEDAGTPPAAIPALVARLCGWGSMDRQRGSAGKKLRGLRFAGQVALHTSLGRVHGVGQHGRDRPAHARAWTTHTQPRPEWQLGWPSWVWGTPVLWVASQDKTPPARYRGGHAHRICTDIISAMEPSKEWGGAWYAPTMDAVSSFSAKYLRQRGVLRRAVVAWVSGRGCGRRATSARRRGARRNLCCWNERAGGGKGV